MRIIILLSLTLFSLASLAQDQFAPVGAKWYYRPATTIPYWAREEAMLIESNRDTIVNGLDARVLRRHEGTVYPDGSSSFRPYDEFLVRGDSSAIWFFDTVNHEFYKHHDFTLEPGDSLVVQDSANYRGIFYPGDFYTAIVDSVETEVINGVAYRRNEYLYTIGNFAYFAVFVHDQWVDEPYAYQFIGGRHEFFYRFQHFTVNHDSSVPYELVCYVDEFRSVQFYPQFCNLSVLSTPEYSGKSIHLYPNPTDDFVQISGVTGSNKVEIYSIAGKLMLTQTIFSEENIDVSSLTAGVYIIRVGAGSHQKLIIR